MPPEMITIVAPTAMMAKKLASVAVWISVYEFRKLLTLSPGDAIGVRAGEKGEERAQADDDQEQTGLRGAEESSDHRLGDT